MAYSTEIELQGVTAFKAPPAPSFRYTIALKDNNLSIWLEDCVSKKQWYKGDMGTSDYISSSNSIPDASAGDYVKCFRDALDCGLEDKSRNLTVLKGGALRLELVMNIQVFRSSWEAKYVFVLDSVSIERIDVLESKLRDCQEELEKFRGKLGDICSHSFATLEATTKIDNSVLLWSFTESDAVIGCDEEGGVMIVHPGVYHVESVVNCAPSGHNQVVTLLKNGEVVQSVFCGYASGYCASVALSAIVKVDMEDELTVNCPCGLSGTSYLSVALLND